MSKGSERRPGDSEKYREAWDKIFGKKMEIEIYSKENCPYCDMAVKQAQQMSSSKYVVYKLGDDFELHELLEKAPNARTFPQIFINGENIGGYTEFSKYNDC